MFSIGFLPKKVFQQGFRRFGLAHVWRTSLDGLHLHLITGFSSSSLILQITCSKCMNLQKKTQINLKLQLKHRNYMKLSMKWQITKEFHIFSISSHPLPPALGLPDPPILGQQSQAQRVRLLGGWQVLGQFHEIGFHEKKTIVDSLILFGCWCLCFIC